MSYLDTFKKFRSTESNELEDNSNLIDDEQDDFPLESDLDEISVAGDAGGYETPNAFGDLSDDTIEMMGYKKVKKVKKEAVKESEFKRLFNIKKLIAIL
jgi:hypothetical protein